MGLKLVDVSKALTEFDSLLRRNSPVNGSLNFFDRGFAVPVYKRSDIKSLTGMVEYVVGDGTCRLSKNITEDIIKLQVGDSQAVLGTVFLAGEHIGEFEAVTHQVTELAYFRRGDKTGFYHVAHEQVTDPFGILEVSFVSLLRFGIFGVCEGNKTGFFKDIEDGDPVLAGGFHTDFGTGVFGKPAGQLPQTFGKGRKACLFVLGETVGVGNADTGIDPGFVDIKPTTFFTKNFEQ